MSHIPDLLSDSPPPELMNESSSGGIAAISSAKVGASVPPRAFPNDTASPAPSSPSSSGFLSYPFSRVAGSLTRRITDPESPLLSFSFGGQSSTHSATHTAGTSHSLLDHPQHGETHKKPPLWTSGSGPSSLHSSTVFEAPVRRTISPFAPPPLTGLSLNGLVHSRPGEQMLSTVLAEEIRLLLPPRLQLTDTWDLAFSMQRDGASLTTLYSKGRDMGEGSSVRGGWVLVVKDGTGGVFGAFLTDAPHPSPHYYGTGECFLWRASVLTTAVILQNLPPPPSEDTSNYTQRSTTLASPTSPPSNGYHRSPMSPSKDRKSALQGDEPPGSGVETPEQIRFKAFPYSGVNDYLLYCEADYLSVGGGDGRYGLWLDNSLETGISSHCMTFGNESLSEEGDKFEVLGVELWHIAA